VVLNQEQAAAFILDLERAEAKTTSRRNCAMYGAAQRFVEKRQGRDSIRLIGRHAQLAWKFGFTGKDSEDWR
jgi:hypothetical protein